MIKKILTLISAAAFITAAGCTQKTNNIVKKDTPGITTHSDVVKLKIRPFDVKVVAGKTVLFDATGLDAEGQKIIISGNWKLSDNSAGTLNSTRGNKVTFTAKEPGKTILEAEYNNLKDSVNIEVVVKIY